MKHIPVDRPDVGIHARSRGVVKSQIFHAVVCIALWLLMTLPVQSDNHESEDREVLYWVAPMDPNFRSDQPGKSPMGMDLVPVYADQRGSGDQVVVSPQMMQSLGIRTEPAERSRLWRRIDTIGTVAVDENRVSHIHLRVDGWVENLQVKSTGERVRKGQRLFDLYSPELVNAQKEMLQTQRSGDALMISASRERLIALGVDEETIRTVSETAKTTRLVPVYAPQDGIVSMLHIADGMFVEPRMSLMTLADLSSVWVLADVYEKQVDWVKTGQMAEVQLSYLPGKVFSGVVEYIYPELDPISRTLRVRLRYDNPGELLKPNMYGQVQLYAGAIEETIVIPLQSLIRSGQQDRVIVALGEGRFEARQVKAGIESGNYVEILSGLSESEEVVVSGQFLIDSEASLNASFSRMSPDEAAVTAPEGHGQGDGS